MSHINIGVPSVSSCKKKQLVLDNFSNGVRFCRFEKELYDGQSPYMKNLIYTKNLLRTRFGQKAVLEDSKFAGTLHCVCSDLFFGYYVFHIGKNLVAFNGNEVKVLSEEMPDCESFVFEMNSQLYIFCRCERIFVVDKSIECTEYIIPVADIYTDAELDGSSYVEHEETYTMICSKISVRYRYNSYVTTLNLPCACDTSKPLIIYSGSNSESLYDESSYEVSEDGKVISFYKTHSATFKVVYSPSEGEKYRNNEKIFGCTTTMCYGGKSSSGGTRVFFSGNKDYPGYYFHSELLSPLMIKPLSYDIIGNGSENINCLAKQKGDLIALCDRSVHRISYSFDSDTGPDFTVSEISSKTGCDMPGSIQLIDNRLVFANSSSGVFIIVSSDYTDELSIRGVSENINGTGDEDGLLSENKENLANSFSIDFGRKYYLFVGNHTYVWDYASSPYVAGTDPVRAERALSWFYFDGLCENSVFEINGGLYGTYSDGENCGFVLLSELEMCDFGNPIECEYKTGDFDVSSPLAKKVLREIFLSVLESDGAEVEISAFADGKEVRTESFSVPDGEYDDRKEHLCRLYVRLPNYEAYRFSVHIKSKKGTLGISDALFNFCFDKKYYS